MKPFFKLLKIILWGLAVLAIGTSVMIFKTEENIQWPAFLSTQWSRWSNQAANLSVHKEKTIAIPTERVSLKKFLVNVSDKDRQRHQLVEVHLDLDLEGKKVSPRLKKQRIQLRAIIASILASKDYQQLVSKDGKSHLEQEIKIQLNLILSNVKIYKVLLKNRSARTSTQS